MSSAAAVPAVPDPPSGTAELFSDHWDTVQRYVAALASDGIDHGLIGPRELPRIWDRHIRNSLAAAPFIPPGATVIDVGSGAGLPGIPLALFRPDLSVVLLEPLERRVRFLAAIQAALDLPVVIEHARAEAATTRGEVMVCRAVTQLDRLLPWAVRLVPESHHLVALKGSSVDGEIATVRSQRRWDSMAVERHDVAWPDPAVVVTARRPITS